MSRSEPEALAGRLAGLLESGEAAPLSDAARRRLFTALVRDYSRAGGGEPPIEASGLTAGEVAVTVAAMMRALDVTSFEVAALFNV